MDRNKAIVLVVIVALVGVLGAWFLYNEWYVLDRFTVNTSLKVSDSGIGFNADTDKIAFGKGPRGSVLERYVHVESAVPAEVLFRFDAPYASWIYYPRTLLDAGEEREVKIEARIPYDAEPGNYSGTMEVVYVRRLQ